MANDTLRLVKALSYVISGDSKCQTDIDITKEKDVLQLAIHHNVANILYASLCHKTPNISDAAQLENIYNQAIAADAAQGYYLEMVKGLLEENGIDYCILKGWVIKALYPSSDLRMAADIDIYIGHENAQRVHDIMLEHGFECSAFGENGSSDDYHMDIYSHI